MNIDLWILAFSAVTVLVTIWMGFRSAKKSKTASDFFVAGRSVSVGWNASAISGEYLSAASFMGVAGMVMSSGYDALWYPVCYACGYLFLLLFIAGPLRRFGAYTIPDFAEGRFDSPVFRKIAVVFVLFIGFFYTMPQMKGAGTTLAYIFPGLPYWAGVVLVGAVITLNVALGGMKGITLVQAFQYWAKMFAISVPIFVLMAVYGHYGKQVGLNHNFAPQGNSFIQSSNVPVATAFLRNPNESILVSLAAQEVAPKTLSFPAGITYSVGSKFEVSGTIECDGKTQPFQISTNSFTVHDGLRRVAPALRDLVDGFGWIAPEKRGTAIPVQFSAEQLFDRVEFPANSGLGHSLYRVGVAIGASRPRATLSPGPTVQMRTLLDACLKNRSQRNRVILYFAAELYEKTTPAPINRNLTLERLGDYFATNGVAVVWAAEDAVKVFPAASSNLFMPVPVPEGVLTVSRVPLPAKAPADVTWLNPFGPLTTKAAKNAAAAIGKQAAGGPVSRWESETNSPAPTFPLSHFPALALRPGLSPEQRMTVNLDSPTVGQALTVYADLTGRQLLPNTNSIAERMDGLLGGRLSQLKLVARTPTPDSGIREHNDGIFTAREVKAAIEAHLATNGIALVAEGKTGFRPVQNQSSAETQLALSSAYNGPWETGSVAVVDAGIPKPVGERIKNYVTVKATANTQTGSTGTVSAETLFLNFAYFSGRAEPLNFSGVMRCLYAPELKSIVISNWPGFALASHDQVVDQIRQALQAKGLSVIREGRDLFKAFPDKFVAQMGSTAASSPAFASRAAAAEKAWLDKHEKPLALLYTYSLIIALVCGTAGLPHILVRFYTNPDGVAAKRTTMWVMILIGVFYVFPPVFGVLGRNLMPDLYTGLAGIKGTDQVVLKLPVLLNQKYPPLGSILSGITCAGAFAAFMSTFSGLLVSMTGALAHDVYGRILRPRSTPEQRMRMFKIGAVLLGGVAVLLGSFVEPLEINFMVGQAFAIAAASYFPLLFMAVWWRKLTMKGAAIGMLTGGVCALVAAALTNFSNLALDKGPMGKIFAGFAPLNEFWAEHPLLRILCEQPAIWAVPLAILLMVIVSKLTSLAVPSDIRMKMLVLHAPEKLGLKQEYIQEHQQGH